MTTLPSAANRQSLSSGHSPWLPRLPLQASQDVLINGEGALRVGDQYNIHCKPDGSSCHPGSVSVGSNDVFVNGEKLAYVGSLISCGDHVGFGSSDVNVGT
jgi:uncharacterized Zn-binding protein involved in type VI secretion